MPEQEVSVPTVVFPTAVAAAHTQAPDPQHAGRAGSEDAAPFSALLDSAAAADRPSEPAPRAARDVRGADDRNADAIKADDTAAGSATDDPPAEAETAAAAGDVPAKAAQAVASPGTAAFAAEVITPQPAEKPEHGETPPDPATVAVPVAAVGIAAPAVVAIIAAATADPATTDPGAAVTAEPAAAAAAALATTTRPAAAPASAAAKPVAAPAGAPAADAVTDDAAAPDGAADATGGADAPKPPPTLATQVQARPEQAPAQHAGQRLHPDLDAAMPASDQATSKPADAAQLLPVPGHAAASQTGGAAPAHAPAPAATAAAQTAALPVTALAVEIAARASAGKNRFEIRLDPPELGKIDVRLDIDRHGQVTSRLIVEKSETLDLLRRDAPQLERALQDAGLKTSGNGLQFSLQQQTPQHDSDTATAPRAAQLVVTEEPPPDIIHRGYATRAAARGGIDIRV